MPRFSVLDRPDILNSLQREQFDLLVIGGGITGAGIALDASSRGLKTALVEKNDFAYGTSSRSTKLIHGGLRYLKQLEFGLVKEVGSERAIVHDIAPHLVIPEKMLLPLYEKKGLGYWLTSIGLKIYDFLAGVSPVDQRKMLTKAQTLRYEPLLQGNDINGGAIYAEYRTDDARLTIELMKQAFQFGALTANYLQVIDFVYQEGMVQGVLVRDELTGNVFPIQARTIVNAAGPWVDNLREINNSKVGKRLRHTKGVHIVVDRKKLPVKQAIYFDVEEDGRMIFAIPRGSKTYVGTTDTDYSRNLDDVVTTSDDAAYLLRAVNATFQGVRLTIDDIESSWAGLRPLIHEDGKSPSELSRKDEIFESKTGLISIAGGKLTGYRKMAERIVNLAIKRHFVDRPLKKCITAQIKLPGAEFKNYKDVESYIQSVKGALASTGLAESTASYLVSIYGRQSERILAMFFQSSHYENARLDLLKAELRFAIEHEMVVHLSDFFVRRTGLLYFDIGIVLTFKDNIASFMKTLLNWTDERIRQESLAVDKLIDEAAIAAVRQSIR